MKIKKKPISMEAIQHWNDYEKFKKVNDPIPKWYLDYVECGTIATQVSDNPIPGHLPIETYIKTSAGNMFCSEGDWIIKDINGEIFPCPKKIFEETYEKTN